VQILNL